MIFKLSKPKTCSCGKIFHSIKAKPEETGEVKIYKDPRDGSEFVWYDCYDCKTTGVVHI
jgi:hypothetical protein